ncbi:MAG: hypothetical protein AAGE89_01560 [Pseudomonadota bacterium]
MLSLRSFCNLATVAGLAAITAACSNGNAVPNEDPQAFVKEGRQGYRVFHNVAIGPNDRGHWVSSLTRNYQPLVNEEGRHAMQDARLSVGSIDEFPACQDIGGMVPGTAVHHVHAEEVKRESRLYMIPHDFVEGEVWRLKAHYEEEGTFPEITTDVDAHHYDIADVFVNGIDEPVHLILTTQRPVVWNIQAAPGVTISNISIISSKATAVVNAPETTTIKALTEYTSRCGLVPARKPAKHWQAVQQKAASDSNFEFVEEAKTAFYIFDAFFFRNFDQSAAEGTVGAEEGRFFLVGTPPSKGERPDYRSIAGSTIKTSAAGYVFLGSKRDYQAVVKTAMVKRAEKAMGRKIDLKPATLAAKSGPGAS